MSNRSPNLSKRISELVCDPTNNSIGYRVAGQHTAQSFVVVADREIINLLLGRLQHPESLPALKGSIVLVNLEAFGEFTNPTLDNVLSHPDIQGTLFFGVPAPSVRVEPTSIVKSLYGTLLRKLTILAMIDPTGLWNPGALPETLWAWPTRS